MERLTAEQAEKVKADLIREREERKRPSARSVARDARERRYREALPEEAGALVVLLYDHGESLRTGRREFRDGDLSLSTTDVAQLLLDGARVYGYADAEALAPVVNNYLVGCGFRLRSYPRKLGLGNQSPDRPDPRAQAQRRVA